MYLTTTRPGIMHAVSIIDRYMEFPTEMHLLAAKRIFQNLQGTSEYGLFYKNGEKSSLVGFTDSDYAGDLGDRKLEFVAATVAIWLKKMLHNLAEKKILEELYFKQEGATKVYSDNSSVIKLTKNPVLHGRSKHIDVKFHFLRDLTRDGVIELYYCKSEDQIADIMTKTLKLPAFQKLRELLGVCVINKSLN
ncbi:putative mitochondrial protein [Cucumis melo var. makuwa]|uniref:Mitochondrial protein n=1 Tax=Cucumis melo var. makuwa TaxID=1194695 RepID=A0A5D3DWT6_CUCMM|nr:putative mitochondrial protein [Cucumis melo var. makuwa]TYK27898.1 putative mitochondrial protein [Cucumis melo var. makuwa]